MRGDVPFDAFALEQVLQANGLAPTALRRLFTRPERDLERERERARQRSGRELADLNLYYRIAVPTGIDAGRLCDALNRLAFVELAAPVQRAAPPADLSPPTPDLAPGQGYLAAPPHGIGLSDPIAVPGADGAGTAVVDVEFNWILDHEDLELGESARLDPETPFSDDVSLDHGTAVLGVIGALHNGYGVDGIAPAATLLGAYASTAESGDKIAEAISLATAALEPGDVILVEAALPCACGVCHDFENAAAPAEWDPFTFDAISIATALGIGVVEPAGNGGFDLDAPGCLGLFDRRVRDSGAILVGAGTQARQRVPISSFGSRVDLQGWGFAIATLGFGDAFATDPDDPRQRYTRNFGGTSGAAAIVTGVALAVQGSRKARSQAPLEPAALRQQLVATGTPQSRCDPPERHVGPLPNLPALLGLKECSDHLDNDGDGRVDAGSDPGCSHPADTDEFDLPPVCADALDNDGDGASDLADPDCRSPSDRSEHALRTGDLLVVDSHGMFERAATAAVFRVAPSTGFQTPIMSGRPLLDPAAAALDGNGNLLVTDFTAGTLVSIDPRNGARTVVAECLRAPWGVAVAPDGAIFVAAAGEAAVLEVDRATGATRVLSSGDQLSVPRGLAVLGANALVVADSGSDAIVRVNRFTGAQTLIATGPNLRNPRGIAVDAHGDVYTADIATRAIVRVELASGLQTVVSSGGRIVTPRNLAIDAAGRILLAEADDLDGSGSVLRIDPKLPGGAQTVVAAGGRFVDPTGLVVVPEPGGALPPLLGVALVALLGRRRRGSRH
jgi:sugar lactone lactonase YvrE